MGKLAVAYVPSPSFSSCWKADGLFVPISATVVNVFYEDVCLIQGNFRGVVDGERGLTG